MFRQMFKASDNVLIDIVLIAAAIGASHSLHEHLILVIPDLLGLLALGCYVIVIAANSLFLSGHLKTVLRLCRTSLFVFWGLYVVEALFWNGPIAVMFSGFGGLKDYRTPLRDPSVESQLFCVLFPVAVVCILIVVVGRLISTVEGRLHDLESSQIAEENQQYMET